MDTQALKEKIRQLEGLTDEERKGLLALLNHQKKYGLVWEEKPEEAAKRLRTQLPVLEEVKERALLSDDPTAPNHILIEGDNLEALVALTYTHEGKVDVIYIDPPYNTGNKDFTYNDCYVDAEDGYRHSKWLSFMSKRLKIAKQLLSDRGVIFISIDDNEQAQLKLLCDEVFGEKNHINTISINMNSLSGVKMTHAIKGKRYPAQKEYLLLYAKGEQRRELIIEKVHKRYWDKEYNMIIPQLTPELFDNFSSMDDGAVNALLSEMSLCSLKDYLKTNGIGETDDWKWHNAYRIFGSKSNRPLANRERANSYAQDVVCYTNTEGNKRYFMGRFNRKATDPRIELVQAEANGCYFLSDNWIDISNDGGVAQEGGVVFPKGKKPLQLIERILRATNDRNAIILDFFAGSGTTFHAALNLNKEDGGKRTCIISTSNESSICEDITYKRLANVIQGFNQSEGLKSNTLRYYRTKLLPRAETNQNRHALMEACTELLCIQQDLYAELPCFAGRKLNPRKARYFAQGKRKMLVIYDEQTIDTFAELLREMEVEEKIRIYLFSFNGYPYTDNFMEVLDKVELCALPQAIYNVYKRVLPKEADPAKEKEEKA